jgi:DNA replication protein DnaC
MTKKDFTQLEALLAELGFKSPPEQVDTNEQKSVIKFLVQEKEARQEYRLKRLMSASGIRPAQVKTFEQFDWNFNTKLPKQDLLAFRNSDWITQPANLVLIGDSGLGKSHLAKALCYDALVKGVSAYFTSIFDLTAKLKKAVNPHARVEYYGKSIKVLCLDEVGYSFHDKEDMDLIFQIISKRSELLPTIVTTNLVPKQWGSIFSGTAASAILDRLSFNGKFLTLEGKSYRLRSKKK